MLRSAGPWGGDFAFPTSANLQGHWHRQPTDPVPSLWKWLSRSPHPSHSSAWLPSPPPQPLGDAAAVAACGDATESPKQCPWPHLHRGALVVLHRQPLFCPHQPLESDSWGESRVVRHRTPAGCSGQQHRAGSAPKAALIWQSPCREREWQHQESLWGQGTAIV